MCCKIYSCSLRQSDISTASACGGQTPQWQPGRNYASKSSLLAECTRFKGHARFDCNCDRSGNPCTRRGQKREFWSHPRWRDILSEKIAWRHCKVQRPGARAKRKLHFCWRPRFQELWLLRRSLRQLTTSRAWAGLRQRRPQRSHQWVLCGM